MTDLEYKRHICEEYSDIKNSAPYGYGTWPHEFLRTIDILQTFGWEWGHRTSYLDFNITKGYYITNNGTGHKSDPGQYYVHWDNGNIGRLQFVSSEYWGDVEDEWREFLERLKSYNPINYDPHNSHIVYDVENGKRIMEDYDDICKEFNDKFQRKIKKLKIERKQKELEKLMQEVEE